MSVASNLVGGRHGNLALTMTKEEYLSQTGYAFVPPHNPVNYPPTMGTAQEQALRTKRFRQNKALFKLYTTMDRAIKNILIW